MLLLALQVISLITHCICSVSPEVESKAAWEQLRAKPKFGAFKKDLMSKLSQYNVADADSIKSVIEGASVPDYAVHFMMFAENPRIEAENAQAGTDFEIIYDKEADGIEVTGEIYDVVFTVIYSFKDPKSSVYLFKVDEDGSEAAEYDKDSFGNSIILKGKDIQGDDDEDEEEDEEESSDD